MTRESVAAAAERLAAARDVTLLAHVNPDADALGSALALGIALRRRGATVRVAFAEPDRMPESLVPLDVCGLVVPPAEVPAAAELLVACDAAAPARLGALADRLATAGATVMIDHHASNPGFGDVQVLDPAAEATVVLVHRVLVAMGEPLGVDVARCLYAGLVTDTRGFRTAGPDAHRIAAELVAAGVDPEALVRPIMDTHPYAWLAALGGALERAVLEPAAAGGLGLVHTTVPLADVARFRTEEVDGVVDVLRTAAEAEVAAVLKQVAPDRWVTSLRSTGRVDVAAAAIRLGGGGHRAAAGFTCDAGLDDVLAALRRALEPDIHRSVDPLSTQVP
ncbi:DHH family phosphoesterase [Pseudonocardia nigra]|uniref:DHH family phosphoesterase n=1 Tax=Pseudonocardia nigra TaxID=1921578 RepID=UPI001C5E6289|nr:DHH family phosphoesterase [Pseudonocardia nigra]